MRPFVLEEPWFPSLSKTNNVWIMQQFSWLNKSFISWRFYFIPQKLSSLLVPVCVFGKVGRVASPDVVVQLVKTKFLPVLHYATEVCPTNKSDVLSLQYVTDTCFRKIFNVKSKDVVHEFETELVVFPVTDVIDIRKRKFIVKYDLSDNQLCQLCKNCNDIVCLMCQYS